MPNPLRKLKSAWVVSKIENDSALTPVLIAGTFRSAYKLACFELQIAKPSMEERAIRIGLKRTKTTAVWLWDLNKFASIEEARYSPIGSIAKLEKLPVRKA